MSAIEHNQEMTQAHTTDRSMAPRGRVLDNRIQLRGLTMFVIHARIQTVLPEGVQI